MLNVEQRKPVRPYYCVGGEVRQQRKKVMGRVLMSQRNVFKGFREVPPRGGINLTGHLCLGPKSINLYRYIRKFIQGVNPTGVGFTPNSVGGLGRSVM
jgi:hypothetical protein